MKSAAPGFLLSTHMKDIVTLETFDADADVLVKTPELFNEETCSAIDASLPDSRLMNFHRCESRLNRHSQMCENERECWEDGFVSRFPKLRSQ